MRYVLSSLFFILVAHLFAVPARPGRVKVKMPDGTQREVILRGDERCHWMQDSEGREIVGSRVVWHPSTTTTSTATSSTSLRPGIAKVPGTSFLLDGSFSTVGKRRLLAVLINYANTVPVYSREDFDAMLNEEGFDGVGSFRDYYLDQSGGLLDIQTDVTEWITVSQPRQYYNADNTPSLIAEALKNLDPYVDFRNYDNDGDGILDGLLVIHAGHGQEASGDAADIWSHSSTIYGMQFDGVSLYRYTIQPERLYNGHSTIGVFCHEFGHNLGALDYYDTNYAADGAYGGTGPWDLMGEGAWNGPNGRGTHPAPFTAWQRWQFGWSTPVSLTADAANVEALPFDQNGASYIAYTSTEGDYYVLENVQPTSSWTQYLPGHGLIVTHVIESVYRQRMGMNNLNARYPQAIYTVCADAGCDPHEDLPSSYGDLTSSAAPFPGTRGHTEFSDLTLPSTHSADGRDGYFALSSITEEEGSVRFTYHQGEAPQRPLHLATTVNRGTVRLTWDFPADSPQPEYCTVRRDDKVLANVTDWQYEDTDQEASGFVTYTVDATYPSGLTSAVSTATTRIPPQVATDFSVRVDYLPDSRHEEYLVPYATFQWGVTMELSQCQNDMHYDIVDHRATTFCYAHRFSADALYPHIGRTIRSITFIPQQRSTEASYRICVWRMKATPGQPLPQSISTADIELVASRQVNEFSPTYQRTIAFTERPTISEGYDYLVGVEITSANGLAEVVTDQSELRDGLGNLMSLNGGTWQSDPAAAGNYILAMTLAGSLAPYADYFHIYDLNAIEKDDESLFANCPYRPFEPALDLYHPLGFSIYSDGALLAETTNDNVSVPLHYLNLLASCPAGPELDAAASKAKSDVKKKAAADYYFELVSTYKNGNESHPLTVSLPIDTYVLPHILEPNPEPASMLRDLQGRPVIAPCQHGIYLQGSRKVIR